MSATVTTEFAARIAAIAAAADFGTASAVKRGRNPKWPYVPIIKNTTETNTGVTTKQLLGVAYATREGAVARAQRWIDAERAGLARKLAERGHRALREHHGLPRELPTD